MGITVLNALFLVESWREGVSFTRTLTLGRLDGFITLNDSRRVAKFLPRDSAFVRSLDRGVVPVYMDELFVAMGATCIEALDASDFEGATFVHDLNDPLEAHLHSQYDAIVDGGTLEHIFNIPVAFKNVMDALKVGGHFFATLPANDLSGHGFYQFSADFFYRTFCEENGFEIVKLLVAPLYVAGKWLDGPVFDVMDPVLMRGRVEIHSRKGTVFLVQARKVSNVAVFSTWPQQSDYSAAWSTNSGNRKDAGAAGAPSRLPLWSLIASRFGGVGRIITRRREKRAWTRQCRKNPALKPHAWSY
jgi:hypothetical protein